MHKLIIMLALNLMVMSVNAAEVTVLHTDKKRVNEYQKKGYEITYMNVDGLNNSISRINSRLPANQAEASKIAAQMVKRQRKAMESGMRGISLISKWDIKKLPAIVFGNGDAVYYGSDVESAIKEWEKQL